MLVAQIALGGWVSTNYAVLACTDFPTCNGQWVPQMDFAHGFQHARIVNAAILELLANHFLALGSEGFEPSLVGGFRHGELSAISAAR